MIKGKLVAITAGAAIIGGGAAAIAQIAGSVPDARTTSRRT
jgi:hypothetical protein